MAVVALPHAAASAAVARRRLVEDLRTLGVAPDVIADAELVLAEMIGNAVRHARPLPGGTVSAGWEVRAGEVLLRVDDGGASTAPAVQRNLDTRNAERGRGLAIVAALSRHWGAENWDAEDEGRGLRTWATIDLT